MGALASLAATLIAIGEASPSQTDGLALQLTWDSPPGCPDLASERAEIRRRVGDIGRAAPIAAHGVIDTDPAGGYRLMLRTWVRDTTGERVLAGQDCRQLADAAALVLALLISPEGAVHAEPELAEAVPRPVPPDSTPVARPRYGLGLGTSAVLASGVLPSLAAGLVARLFYRRGILALAYEITGFLPVEQDAPVLSGAKASFFRLESALHLCMTTSSDRLGGTLCVGGAMVRLRGRSAGVSAPGQATAYWPEAVLSGCGQLRLTAATYLRIAIELHGFGSRPDFDIPGLGSVYRPAAYHERALVGLDLHF